jgi:hypothetical protein
MEEHDASHSKLTFLKITTPFKLGARTMRIDGGKWRMNQIATAEYFVIVTVDVALSNPLMTSP